MHEREGARERGSEQVQVVKVERDQPKLLIRAQVGKQNHRSARKSLWLFEINHGTTDFSFASLTANNELSAFFMSNVHFWLDPKTNQKHHG